MVNHICCFPNLKLCIGGISSTWFSCTIVFILCDSIYYISVCSVTQSCPTPCDPMNHSMPGLPVHHQLPESTQIHVHWVSDAIQPSHPLSSPSPPAFNLSQHQGLLNKSALRIRWPNTGFRQWFLLLCSWIVQVCDFPFWLHLCQVQL